MFILIEENVTTKCLKSWEEFFAFLAIAPKYSYILIRFPV